MKILPYNMRSQSAKALAQALGVKRVRHHGNFKNNYDHVILNWGSSEWPTSFASGKWLNEPDAVHCAVNKWKAFYIMDKEGVPIPRYTNDQCEADTWEDVTIVARYELNGHSGAGIVLIEPDDSVHSHQLAPLYVEYIKKQDEYRYHVFNGEVIDVQQKKKRRETPNEEVNYQIRNFRNGFIYARDNITPPSGLSDIAIRAVDALGLDFGAVDIIWNEHRQEGYVLEVNTACGLTGTTLDKYADAIIKYLQSA